MAIPKSGKGIIVRKAESKDSIGYINDAVLVDYPIPELQPGQVLVKITAVAFNHKDVWIRKGLYPGITQGSFFGGDGVGIVVASSNENDDLLNQRVILVPTRGWKEDPIGPESKFNILGAGVAKPGGTFAEYLVIEREYLIKTPEHLDDIRAAAFPLGGVTAWRAAVVNGKIEAGHNVLITGIGGGVALLALQYCVAAGASVYVTSGSAEKIQKAVALGAKGGVNYKDSDWPTQLKNLLDKQKAGTLLDSIIDSAGGDILQQTNKVLRQGGRLVCYGQTVGRPIILTMREVMLNQQIIGSTMGSQKDLEDATRFVEKHKLVPVVSQVIDGLESAEEGFELIRRGEQFGKVVIKLRHASEISSPSRL